MENFIDKILESNSDMQVIDSSVDVTNLISDDNEVNGHIWTNIDNYIKQVESVAEGLKKVNEENAAIYDENAREYIEKLNDLKKEYSEALEILNGKKAVVLNEAFEYMGQELGLDMIVIKTDHEESTISAEVLKNTIEKKKKENIEMIIIDKNDNKSNAETISKETGAKIFELNSGLSGTLDKDAYINSCIENISIIQAGLM